MESEQDRFMRLAYARTVAAARKAFRPWHSRKREDASPGNPHEDVRSMDQVSAEGWQP